MTGYLHSTSEKYAATECISNKSYILSHNKNNLVKLWELTGEFISAQNLDGRIVCVCPQTADPCFLAVLETVSEVGQKSASVSTFFIIFALVLLVARRNHAAVYVFYYTL